MLRWTTGVALNERDPPKTTGAGKVRWTAGVKLPR